jgi:L-fuculose-phosphate aldolase
MADQQLREQVAWACRILARQGHADFTLGHVSARKSDGTILMKRNGLGLDEITPADILTIDLDGRLVAGQGKVHLEYVIHTEVYKARPDVGSVVHTHPPYAVALGATQAKLEFLNHDAVLFQDGVAIFNDTVELITTSSQGQAIARALGTRRAMLMQNHGVVVVGQTVPWAVLTALTLERATQIQAIAATLGPLKPISQEMASKLFPEKYQDRFIPGYWDYLIRQLRRDGFDAGMPAES